MCANSREENEAYYSFSIHQLYKHEQYAVEFGITYTLSLFVKIGAITIYIYIAPFKIIVSIDFFPVVWESFIPNNTIHTNSVPSCCVWVNCIANDLLTQQDDFAQNVLFCLLRNVMNSTFCISRNVDSVY
jgi:hypothetical protein